MNSKIENIQACFLGLAIGDALGVPVEFRHRSYFQSQPITTMTGFGSWNQPPGTWSDDSSLTFCLAESLLNGYNIEDVSNRFVRWMKEGYWGAHHRVFDIGGTTRAALQRIYNGEHPLYSGEFDEDSNGNGSLMRIAPASIYFSTETDERLLEKIREVSGITHRHFRSVFACYIYSKVVSKILFGREKMSAYYETIIEVQQLISQNSFYVPEIKLFDRILKGNILSLTQSEILSSGYVLHTLEASLWCFLTTNSYREAVLKAVNLGEDTDTTGCVTGALTGLYYGLGNIPEECISQIARKQDIIALSENFKNCIKNKILAKS